MKNRNILISGAGIAGVTLAFWLKKFGFNPTLIEYAPKLREGGYAIDFWGAGYEVAERMGILPDLERVGIRIPEVSIVNEKGQRQCGINYIKLKKLMAGRAFTLLRSDLSKVIYDHLEKEVEVIFNNSITALEQSPSGVSVKFSREASREFDLVIGADGLHSVVRDLVFGEESRFERFFGYYTSSYTIPQRLVDQNVFLMYNVPGKQAAIYATGKSDTTTTFFVFTSPEKIPFSHHDLKAQQQILIKQFEDVGWRCPELLDAISTAPDFYFDAVSQIHMSHWSKGRITLVGDACSCPSLLSGQGATLSMVGAYILAGELKKADGDHTTAFGEYERVFKPFIEEKQKIAWRFAKSFVPQSRFGILKRNMGIRLMSFDLISRRFVKPLKDDKLHLQRY